nr:retrotransposon protein, putative, unclassified [Tanacetum cinerariifolium]
MKMENYLFHTDYPIWQVIQNGNGPVSVITDTNGMIKVLPPKTAEVVVAREKERKAKTTLLMALPKDHLAIFHKMDDAKEIVFERDVKGTTASSSSNIQNVAFMSADNTSNTNDINDDDLEEMDLKWQDNLKALVTVDKEAVYWSRQVEEDTQNFAMMAYSSSNSGFDNETSADESDSKPVEFTFSDFDSSVETTTSMPALVDNAPKIACEPKVWTDAPIIEEYESDSDDDLVSNDDPYKALKDKGIVDNGCSRHMTGNKAHLVDYQEFKGGSVAFGGRSGKITSKGTIKAGRLLVTKPQNKTPNELLTGRQPIISYIRPFGCYVTILNTIDQLGKFDGKFDSGFLVGYSLNNKAFREELEKLKRQEKEANDAVRKEVTHETQDVNTNRTNLLNAVSAPVSAVGPLRALNDDEPSYPDDLSMPHLQDIYASPSEGIFTDSSYDAEGVVTDFNNLDTTVNVSPTPTTRIHTIHPKTQILGDPLSAVQTRSKISQALEDESWVDSMQEELLQFKIQKVWILVDLPFGKKAIGTKWVYRNKKDEKGVLVRNKARLVAQGHRQEEGIDYDEVFALVARIEAIRIFLAFASYMGFIVYQMDVKNAFLYGTIDEEIYMTQPHGFVDLKFPNKVYKVMKALYGLHKLLELELMKNRFQMSSMGELTFFLGLQVKQKEDGIFISQDKYVAEILKKFDFLSVKTASTPIETQKPLVKDEEAADVNVTSKTSHLQAVKRIFRYLKVHLKLSLWYPKVSYFNLEAYSDSDYAGANLDRNSTTRVLKPPLGMNLVALSHHQLSILPQTRSLTSPVDHQLGDMSYHQDIYDNLSLFKKVFANMKRVGTSFSGVITPLFENMLVPAAEEVGQGQDDVSIPAEPSTSKPHKKHKSKKQQPIAHVVPSLKSSPENIIPLPLNAPIPDADKGSLNFQELVDLCTRLSNKIMDLESEVIDLKSFFTDKIEKLEDKVHKLEEENRILKEKSSKTAKLDTAAPVEDKEESFKQRRMIADMDEDVKDIDKEEPAKVEEVLEASALRKRRDVIIQDPEETAASVIVHTKVQSKDKGKGILIEEPKPLKHKAQIEQDEAFTRQLEAELNANINWNDVIEQVKKSERQNNKAIRYQDLKRKPLTEAQERKNIMIYLKNMLLEKGEEEVTVQEKEVEKKGNKRQGESLEQEIAKKQRVDEEAEEVKTHIQIMANDDDDVYTEATPLSSKVPVVDYQIHHKNNKPYYKIIRADETHKLFLSFITLLKIFNRDDLETLWKIVKERLEVEEESDMSLELLRLVRRQLNEGYVQRMKCLNDSPSDGEKLN